MADTKISGLNELAVGNLASGDWIPIVDVSDSSMAASGTTKKLAASAVVQTANNQTIAGTKTFSSAPVVPNIMFSNGNFVGFGVQGSTVSVSTSTTTILSIGSRMSLNLVYGRSNDGSQYFSDLVMCMAFGGAAQAQSIGSITFGSPAARTYSISSGSLTLAMASGTYNVQAGQIFRIADP